MTKWRTPKLALVSVLWMLCAFMVPVASSVCTMPASMAMQCAMMSDVADTSQSPSAQAATLCCALEKPAAMRCCPLNNSVPTLIAPVVSASANRVLDVYTISDATVVRAFPLAEFQKVRFQFQRAEQSNRLCSLDYSPPSGRAPPVVES